jgi:hypothetical protein
MRDVLLDYLYGAACHVEGNHAVVDRFITAVLVYKFGRAMPPKEPRAD